MAESGGVEALRRAILQDAAEAARAQIEQAQRLVAEEQERARREAEAERTEILRVAGREAESLRRRFESIAELESRRRLLEVREKLLREVLDRALARLREMEEPERRRDSLLLLTVEAARDAGGGRLVVQTSPADMHLLTGEFLAEVVQLLGREELSAEMEVAQQPAQISGGAIVSGQEGRIVVDNCWEARLSRQEPDFRRGIWQILVRVKVNGETSAARANRDCHH